MQVQIASFHSSREQKSHPIPSCPHLLPAVPILWRAADKPLTGGAGIPEEPAASQSSSLGWWLLWLFVLGVFSAQSEWLSEGEVHYYKGCSIRLEFLCQFLEGRLNSSKRVPLELNCVYPMNILFIFKWKRPYNRQVRVWYPTPRSALNTDPDQQSFSDHW